MLLLESRFSEEVRTGMATRLAQKGEICCLPLQPATLIESCKPLLVSNCGYSLSTQYIPFLRELIINSKLFQCFMAKYGQQHRDTIPHPHSIAFRHGPIKQKLHMMRAATASPLSFGQKAVSWTQSPAKKLQDCQCCNPAKYAANTQWWDQVLRLWFLDLTMTGQMARVGA